MGKIKAVGSGCDFLKTIMICADLRFCRVGIAHHSWRDGSTSVGNAHATNLPLRNLIPVPLALFILATGCGKVLGPESFKTTRVTGTIHAGTKTYDNGWIEFVPIEGTVGVMRSGRIHPGGTFEVDRVALGTNSVGIFGANFSREYNSVFNTLSTPIRRKITDSSTTPLDIDLMVERARYQNLRADAAAARDR